MRHQGKIVIAVAGVGAAAAGVGLSVAHFTSHPVGQVPLPPFRGPEDYAEVQRDPHLDEVCRPRSPKVHHA